MERGCLAVSFYIEIYASGVVCSYFLISCAPVVDGLPPGAPAGFLREGCAGPALPCRVLVVVLITCFLPSVRGMGVLTL
jgi:hypothetical protein